MCRTSISKDKIEQTSILMKNHSNSEIAARLDISVTTVKRIIKDNKFQRTQDEQRAIRSRLRKELIRAEWRRSIYGLDQKTGLKVFTNRERNSLKYCLKRLNYRFFSRGDISAYYDERTKRNPAYEERGRKLGIKFFQMELSQ